MIRLMMLATAATAIVCGSPALAQDVTCDVKKACVTDHIDYDPDEADGFIVFGNVGVYFDGHRVRKLVDQPDNETKTDTVYIEIGNCSAIITQPRAALPSPDQAPDFRRDVARENINAVYDEIKNAAASLSASEPTLLKDEPGMVQYQVVSKWIGFSGTGTRTEVRRITVGYYQMIEKWCSAADEATAQKFYDEHRVRIRTGADE